MERINQSNEEDLISILNLDYLHTCEIGAQFLIKNEISVATNSFRDNILISKQQD